MDAFSHIWNNWNENNLDPNSSAFDFYTKNLKFTFPSPLTSENNVFWKEYLTRAEFEINLLLNSKIINSAFFDKLIISEKNHVRNAIAKLISFRFHQGVYTTSESGSVGGISAKYTSNYETDRLPKDVFQELSSLSFFQPSIFPTLFDTFDKLDLSDKISLAEAKILFMDMFLTNHETAILDVAQKVIDSAAFQKYIESHPNFVAKPGSPGKDGKDGKDSTVPGPPGKDSTGLAATDLTFFNRIKKIIDFDSGSDFKIGYSPDDNIGDEIGFYANRGQLISGVNRKNFGDIIKGTVPDKSITNVQIKDSTIEYKNLNDNVKGRLGGGGATDWSKIDVEKNTHLYKYNETLKISLPLGCTNFTLKICLDGTGYKTIKDDLTDGFIEISPKELFFVFNNKQWGHTHLYEDYLSSYNLWDAYIKIDKVKNLREIYFSSIHNNVHGLTHSQKYFTKQLGADPKILIIPENPFFIKNIKIEVAGDRNMVIPNGFSKMDFKKTATDIYYDEHEIKIKKINQIIKEISTAHSVKKTLILKGQYSQVGNIAKFIFPSIVDKFYKLVFFDTKNTEVYNLTFDTFHEKIICDDKIVRDEVNFNFNKPLKSLFISWTSWEAVNWSSLKIIAFGATNHSMESSTSGVLLPFAETQTKKNSDLINSNHPSQGLILPYFPLFFIEYKTGKWNILNNGYLKNLNWNNTTKVLTIELKSKILGGWVNLFGRFNSVDDNPEVWLMPNGQGTYKAKFYEGYDNQYSKYSYSSTSRPFIFQKYNKSVGEGIIEKCRFILNENNNVNNMDFSTKILDVDNDFRTSKTYGKYTGNSPFKSKTLIFKFRSKNIGVNTVTDGTFFGVSLDAGVVE